MPLTPHRQLAHLIRSPLNRQMLPLETRATVTRDRVIGLVYLTC